MEDWDGHVVVKVGHAGHDASEHCELRHAVGNDAFGLVIEARTQRAAGNKLHQQCH